MLTLVHQRAIQTWALSLCQFCLL